MATIYEIAAKANVSVTTVSRVINKSKNVSATTRDKVTKIINELGYTPNILSQSLATGITNVILVLVHGVDNPFFSSIIKGIEDNAYQNNYKVLIAETSGILEREDQYLELLKTKLVTGCIIMSCEKNSKDLEALYEKYPIVQLIEYDQKAKVPFVSIDYYKASRELMHHFINKGHQKIAFINAGESVRISSIKKYQAYVDILTENDFPVITKELEPTTFSLENAKELTLILLNKHPDITAIFACSDIIAIGACYAIESLNKKCPDDIEVFGYDNLIYSELSRPKISTVDLKDFQLGKKAMSILEAQIKNTDYDLENYSSYQLIFKESSNCKD